MDDFSLYANSEKMLLDVLEKFFQICGKRRLCLSALKCVFFCKELKWCGRIVTAKGYKMDPARLDALRQMDNPKTASELAQFVHCCRWMSSAIPNFQEMVMPLNDVLETAHRKVGKRTTRSIRNVHLAEVGYNQTHERNFRELQSRLQNAVELSHPDPRKTICVFTDASEKFWAGVVTQTNQKELVKPIEE